MAKGKRTTTGAKDRTKYGPTPSRKGKVRVRRSERVGLAGFLLPLLAGIALTCWAVGASVGAVHDIRRSAGDLGTGRMHVHACDRHDPRRGAAYYDCFGDLTPDPLAPAVHNRYSLGDEPRDVTGKDVQVACTPDLDCVRTGAHATLGSVLALYFVLGLVAVGLGLVAAAVSMRWPEHAAPYRRRLGRPLGWGLAALGAVVVGTLIAYWAT